MSPFRMLFNGVVFGLALLVLAYAFERPTLAHAQDAGVQCVKKSVSAQRAQLGTNFDVLPAGLRVYSYAQTRFRGGETKVWVIAWGLNYWVPTNYLESCEDGGHVNYEVGEEQSATENMQQGVQCLRLNVVVSATTYTRNGVAVTADRTIWYGTRLYNRGLVGNKVDAWFPSLDVTALVPLYAIGPCGVSASA